MQANSSQNYVIKTNNDTAYHFYLNDLHELWYHTYSSDNVLTEKKLLSSGSIIDFSAASDCENKIHLICINQEGNLLYYIGLNDKWSHKSLSKIDTKSNIYRYLTIYRNNNYTHLFCTKSNLLNPAVSTIEHLYWNEKSMFKHTVANFIPGKYPSPYQTAFDSMGNIHMVYKILYKNNHQLYYSRFNLYKKKWTSGEIITNLNEDHSHPYILIDRRDNLHLIWCTIENNNFTLKFKQRLDVLNVKTRWSKVQTLYDENKNNLSPIIIQEGNTLKVFSRQNQKICEIYSEDYGNNWSSVNEKIYKSENPLRIILYSNNEIDQKKYMLKDVYGELNEHIVIFGTGLFKEIKQLDNENNSENSKQESFSAIGQEETEKDLSHEKETCGNKSNYNYNQDKNNTVSNNELSDNTPKMDLELKNLIQEIQDNISRIMNEVHKIENFKKVLEECPLEDKCEHTPGNSIEDFHIKLKIIKEQLFDIDEEKHKLKMDIENFNNKITCIDKKINQFKKEYLFLEEQLNKFYTENSGFLGKLKDFFR